MKTLAKKRRENRRPEKKKERKIILQKGKKCKCLQFTQSQLLQGGTTEAEATGIERELKGNYFFAVWLDADLVP